jgi:hypothetical protein
MSAELLAELNTLHKPELRKREGMVYEIWQDGEITLTKSGSIYGQRNLHMIVPGLGHKGVNVKLVDDCGQNSCMAVENTDLKRARELIMAIAGVDDYFKTSIPG